MKGASFSKNGPAAGLLVKRSWSCRLRHSVSETAEGPLELFSFFPVHIISD